jgi:erythromycin esterase-like protein
LVAKSSETRFLDAVQDSSLARQLLTYHAAMAVNSPNRIAEMLGLRDLMMADNLAHICERERERGKVFVFAHNMHLQRGQAVWQWGPDLLKWWPAGAHVSEVIKERYAVIGSAVNVLESQGIAEPEPETLEAKLAAAGKACFIPTRAAPSLPEGFLVRSGSTQSPGYFPLTANSLKDFDALMTI